MSVFAPNDLVSIKQRANGTISIADARQFLTGENPTHTVVWFNGARNNTTCSHPYNHNNGLVMGATNALMLIHPEYSEDFAMVAAIERYGTNNIGDPNVYRFRACLVHNEFAPYMTKEDDANGFEFLAFDKDAYVTDHCLSWAAHTYLEPDVILEGVENRALHGDIFPEIIISRDRNVDITANSTRDVEASVRRGLASLGIIPM
jgi:hypothetical protein